jgi:predicted pyridoxine 5'-phosphate oxidase superfamily flavin-nucleotide-binding protein
MADAKSGAVTPNIPDWHRGEVALQRHAGAAERMAGLAPRVVRDHLSEQQHAFFQQLPNIVVGVVDDTGDAWATILGGAPGFVRATDLRSLHIGASACAGDPAAAGLTAGAAVGLLGIDLARRRRYRVNGVVRAIGAASFDVDVVESFGNCPQYIRSPVAASVRGDRAPSTGAPQTLSITDPCVRDLIVHAERLFIASYHDDGQARRVDVSHKGGEQGFVKIDGAGRLLIPDFAGNRFFNTLGNILLTPQCGLVFVDFANGDVLQMTGEGTVVLDPVEIAGFAGAERLLRVEIKRLVFRPDALRRTMQ